MVQARPPRQRDRDYAGQHHPSTSRLIQEHFHDLAAAKNSPAAQAAPQRDDFSRELREAIPEPLDLQPNAARELAATLTKLADVAQNSQV